MIEIEVRRDEFVGVLAPFGEDRAARIDEVAAPVEAPDVPRRFDAHAVDAAHEEAVGHGVGGLFEFPEVLAEARHGGRRVEDDLGAVEPQDAGALGDVAVVAELVRPLVRL